MASPVLPASHRALPKAPRRRNAAERVDLILDATERYLLEQGLDGIGLPAIARTAGLPAASLYHLFPSTEAALVGLLRRYNALMDREFNALAVRIEAPTWQEWIRQLFAAGRDFYRRHPAHALLVFRALGFGGLRRADDGHIMEQGRAMAAELDRRFLLPPVARLDERLAIAIALSDRVWAFDPAPASATGPAPEGATGPACDGVISDATFEESQRAVLSYLGNYLPPVLERRPADTSAMPPASSIATRAS
ncbi:TetR/AcrR family transcriptional regulator [Parapedomonas caeni]|jgi:AcrR family transcriptional regulator